MGIADSGTHGGAQSFGVADSGTVSPKVCAPGGKSDFAWDVREAARTMPEADNLNPFVVAFQPVDDIFFCFLKVERT